MGFTYKRIDEIEGLDCHLCREKIGDKKAGLIQVKPNKKYDNYTTGLYHDACWEQLKKDKKEMDTKIMLKKKER